MSQQCIPDEDLISWATGELEAARGHTLETHVATCGLCAQRLMAAARLEHGLFEAGQELHHRRSTRHKRWREVLQPLASAAVVMVAVGLAQVRYSAPTASNTATYTRAESGQSHDGSGAAQSTLGLVCDAEAEDSSICEDWDDSLFGDSELVSLPLANTMPEAPMLACTDVTVIQG